MCFGRISHSIYLIHSMQQSLCCQSFLKKDENTLVNQWCSNLLSGKPHLLVIVISFLKLVDFWMFGKVKEKKSSSMHEWLSCCSIEPFPCLHFNIHLHSREYAFFWFLFQHSSPLREMCIQSSPLENLPSPCIHHSKWEIWHMKIITAHRHAQVSMLAGLDKQKQNCYIES